MSRSAVIIPVHNRRELTLACLRHLRAAGDLDRFTVIVVDDGSTDGTAAAIEAGFPEVEVLRGDGNLWWTGAIALGMQHAFAAGAEAVCWLNDDCLPAPGALRRLLEAAGTAPGQVVAPACFDAATKAPVPNGFTGRVRLSVGPDAHQAVEGLSGFCVALPCAVWARLGPPDAHRFPHYYGDNAYTLRAARAGFPVLLLGAARAELAAFHPPPTLAGLRDPALGRAANWSRMLLSPKSPYRLRTLLAYQRLKYGYLRGTANALARGSRWIAEALWLLVRS